MQKRCNDQLCQPLFFFDGSDTRKETFFFILFHWVTGRILEKLNFAVLVNLLRSLKELILDGDSEVKCVVASETGAQEQAVAYRKEFGAASLVLGLKRDNARCANEQ